MREGGGSCISCRGIGHAGWRRKDRGKKEKGRGKEGGYQGKYGLGLGWGKLVFRIWK